MDFLSYFGSIAALAAGVMIVTDFIIRLFKIGSAIILKSINVRQLIAWIVSFLACFVGVQFDIGIFANIPTWHFVIYGLGVGLVSNGYVDINVMKTILDIILRFLPKKQ